MWADIYSAWKENSHKIRKHATDPCSYPWAIWRCQLTEKAPSITFNKSSSVIPIGWYLIKMSSNLQGFWNRDTNLVWDSATQNGTGHKSGTRNVHQLSNDCKSNFMTLLTFWWYLKVGTHCLSHFYGLSNSG